MTNPSATVHSRPPLKAMILAAGFGTRLLPLTRILPKPMFPVLNRPALEHTILQLRSFGIREITINVHHLPECIIDYFGNGSQFGVQLHFSRESKILGTAGGIKAARQYLEGGPFLVINSDIVADIDLNQVLDFHCKRNSLLTLVVRQDESPEQFDPIEIQEDGRIVHFVGASSLNMPEDTTRVMFTGIQIMETDIFSRIPEGRPCGTTQDIFPEMIESGLGVYGYVHTGYWIDLGKRESYLKLHRDALDGRIRLPATDSLASKIHSSVISPSWIGEGCEIAGTARIGPYAVLGTNCVIEENAVIENSVCWDKVRVEKNSVIKDAILGNGVKISKGQRVIDQSLIA